MCVHHAHDACMRAVRVVVARTVPPGVKDPEGVCSQRLQVAHIRAAQAAGDTAKALELLQAMAAKVADSSSDEERGALQLMLADVHHQVGDWGAVGAHRAGPGNLA